jgi:simple sugar transport system permease protein
VGALLSSLLALVYSVACLELRSNIFIAGLATNLLATGIVPYLSQLFFRTTGVVRVEDTTVLPRLLGVPVTTYGAVFVVAAVYALLNHTRFGLRLRAVGDSESILESRGLRSRHYQRLALVLSGTLAGLAGAELALRLGVYVPNISAGRGWIALVAVFLGMRRPFGVLAAATLFATLEALSVAAQASGMIPASLLLAAPFACTFVAIVIYSAVGRSWREQRNL